MLLYLIMDCQEINGMQTLLQIKKHAPEIPVIVITGNKDKGLEHDFYTAGYMTIYERMRMLLSR